jgi:hypothetical protein
MAGFDRVGPANSSVPSDIIVFCGGACLGAFGEFERGRRVDLQLQQPMNLIENSRCAC